LPLTPWQKGGDQLDNNDGDNPGDDDDGNDPYGDAGGDYDDPDDFGFGHCTILMVHCGIAINRILGMQWENRSGRMQYKKGSPACRCIIQKIH
jgi:hypothetical protein